MHRRDVVLEHGFAAGLGEETSPGQGHGLRQQSKELPWMQNSFSQLLPRALVLSQAAGPVPLARILVYWGAALLIVSICTLWLCAMGFGSQHREAALFLLSNLAQGFSLSPSG